MSDSTCDKRLAEESRDSKLKMKEDHSINESPEKRRHIIKGNNVKLVGSTEKPKSSPLTKSLELIGRLSKIGKTKTKDHSSLNESYEGMKSVETAKLDNTESSVAIRVGLQQTSPCSSHVSLTSAKAVTSSSDSKLKKGKKKTRSK